MKKNLKISIVLLSIFILGSFPAFASGGFRDMRSLLTVDATVYSIDSETGSSLGPSVSFLFRPLSKLGFNLSLGGFLDTNRGYDTKGFYGDVGLWTPLKTRGKIKLALGGGFTFLSGNNSDGGYLREQGLYASLHGLYWLKRSIGTYFRITVITWLSDPYMNDRVRFGARFSLGIAFRLK